MNHKVYLRRRDSGLCVGCGLDVRLFPDIEGVRCPQCLAKRRQHKADSHWMLKLKVLRHYGRECVCCGERRPEALEIDHIDGKGKEHRESGEFTDFYKWLERNGYPKENFQILCSNCNLIKGRNVWRG